MNKKPSFAQVVAVLELFARFHPDGLGLLLGNGREPDGMEIAEMISSLSPQSGLGIRVMGGRSIPEAERIITMPETVCEVINAIGGWDYIHKITREVSEDFGEKLWREAVDYSVYISRQGNGNIRGEYQSLNNIFNTDGTGKHDICARTAKRRFRNMIRVIALKIRSFPPNGGFELESSTSGGYPK